MDTSIRSLLVAAQKTIGQEKNPALLQAYSLLRNVAETKPAVDTPESFSPDLYVLCAEIAFQYGMLEMARECLKMYFMKPPPGNQFLCRAYLCQAQLLAPTATNPEQLEKAVVYLVKAISFAKENPRYHFLVYNASVIYWQFCRPFLKQHFRQYLARSLHTVVKALDDIDDQDYEWRAQLMIALIECNLDAGKKNDAGQIATAAATFIKQNVPDLYKKVFGLIVRNQLIDSSKLHKDVKGSAELAIFYKICKIKVSLENNEPKEYYAEIQRILNQMNVAHSETNLGPAKSRRRMQSPSSVTDGERSMPPSKRLSLMGAQAVVAFLSAATSAGLTRRNSQRNLAPSPAGSVTSTSPDRSRSTSRQGKRPKDADSSSTSCLEESSSLDLVKSPSKGAGRRTPTPVNVKKIAADSTEKPYLLLELARLCLELEFPDLAQDCADHMKTCTVKEQGFYLELEYLGCDIMVKNLLDKQDTLHKHVVDVRIQAIKRCEEAIMNAIRLGEPNVIQAGCVTQWNLCLPLLQPNLRHLVRKPLTHVADALEAIQSLLVQLRCQIHTELAKCEEDQEQISVAMAHLKKALSLDDGHVYRERLEVALKQLELRSELYTQPESPEDIAGMIIEQARKANSGTMRMKRSLLVKAGEALAPDAFLLVLDSESDTKDVTGGKAPLTQIRKLANKARQYNKCVRKAAGHLQRLGDDNDRERARLWADLAKTARKQEVWDVCRVAARFCLLYDDARWKNVPPAQLESPKPPEKSKTSDSTADGTQSSMEKQATQTKELGASRPTSPAAGVALYDRDLNRMLAEVNFVQGEAMVHLLRTDNVQLNDAPVPPVDRSRRPKGYVAQKPEEDPDWMEYCVWVRSLSERATGSFLRGLELGVELGEAWLVACATAYFWNYSNHVLTQRRHREILATLTTVYNGLKTVGHACETMSMVNICNALSYALMQPWMPEPSRDPTPPASPTGLESPAGKKAKVDPKAQKSKSSLVTISPDAMPDLKKAIEVCEYALEATNGTNPQDLVPIPVRMLILQTWVAAKQMAQQQITRTLGIDDEPFTEGQRQMSRAIVAVEMQFANKNGIMEFKETPVVSEIAAMVEECRWSDKFVELQLWARLTSLAHEQKQHNLVVRCSHKALRFAAAGTQPKNRKQEPHRYVVEQEMLSYASGLLGQSLVENMSGQNSVRREGLVAFLNSARFAGNADNYEMVMTAARHYWNACVPLVSQPIERELLRDPIRIILQCISTTAEKEKKKDDKREEGEKEDPGAGTGGQLEREETVGGIGAVEDDLTLRAALYGVLFQSYADKGEWEEGLREMDQAITDMPRTKHRLLIFKHRVMTKAKLGRSVAMDIQKFKDESEDYVAHMWRRVALSSKATAEQLLSYQNAIEALNSASTAWLKVELLLEFGQWLYARDFPLPDAVHQIEWAVDIMLNMQADVDARRQQEARAAAEADAKKAALKGSKKGDKKSGVPAPKSAAKVPSAQQDRTSPEGQRRGGSGRGVDGRSEASEGASERTAEGIVPTNKEAVIGVLPANPGLRMGDVTDVRVLDGLVAAHVLLAEVAGRSSPLYTDYLLLSHAFLMRILQVSVPQSGPTMKEIAKNPPTATDPGKENTKGSAKKKADKGQEKTPAKEKPKRKGPLDVLPGTVEEWAVYDVPDEVIEAFKHEMMEENGINKKTVPKPMLSLYYVDSLVRQLREVGYHQMTLPVLAYEDLLSRGILSSDSLRFLVHMQAVEVCLELNLKAGCTFHEKICGPVSLSETDQARSRDEIAVLQEKQAQVVKEEQRVKETIARLGADSKAQSKLSLLTSKQSTVVPPEDEVALDSHLGRVLGAVTFRDVWTDTAQVLIRQGHYQTAREFLNEAYTAATAFGDVQLQARILHLLARLSYEEAQYGQAVNICKQAQALYHGDEQFWYDTTILMVDATLHDYENRKAKRVARGVLVHSLNQFSRLLEERPNRSSTLGYIIAMLEVKLASTQWSIILDECPDINVPKVMKRVHEICERFDEGTMKLCQLGYRREVLPIMKEHAAILHCMARDSLEPEIRHTYYLQAMMVLKDAVNVSEDVLFNIQTLYSLQQMRSVSLPVQREVADVKVGCGEVMLEMFGVHAHEARRRQLDDQRKGSVLKMVEEFIRATPDYTHMEREWVDATETVIEDAVIKFLDAHSLASSIPRLKTRALCGVGQCLRALAMHTSPDPATQWAVQEMELAKLCLDTEEEEGEREELDPHSRQFLKYARQIRDIKVADGVCRHYLVQATECLVQALISALQRKYVDVAATASLELVECFGQFDHASASLFLALFQSCETALRLEGLLNKAQLDPLQSKLAALLRQRDTLLSRDVSTNSSCSAVMATVTAALDNDWQAWKKLEILPSHLEMLKEFPANFNFVILQHSPDKSVLYGAVLDKPRSAPAGDRKANPKQSIPVASRARVFAMGTSAGELGAVLARCQDHRQNVQQLLLKQEYQRSQAAMRRKMLENLDDSIRGQKSKTLVDESEREECQLQDEFRDLVSAIELYLKPVMDQIDGVLTPPATSPSTSTVEKPGRAEPKEHPAPPQEYVVVLADPDLMELPLEALRAFQGETIVSLSRDFSLQLFYHRFHQDIPPGEKQVPSTSKKEKGGPPSAGKGGSTAGKLPDKGREDAAAAAKKAKAKSLDQPFSRIPGMRDASKKQAKIIPLTRPGNPWNQLVDTMNFRFIVDPHLDCAETEENKPIDVFNKVLELYEQQFTPRWLGVMGDEHSPSVGEWEIYLIENSSFIFYGMEKLFSYLPPCKLSALNIPDCMIVYFLDMAQTTKSFTAQSKVDVLKSNATLALEKPVETAMLTSLTGVKCVLANQWHCTLAENANKLNTTMKDLLDGGLSTGEMVRLLFAPYRRKVDDDGGDGDAGSDAGKSGAEAESAKDGSETSRSQASDKTSTSVLEYPHNIDVQRSWFNLVCYGLPNLIVTQI